MLIMKRVRGIEETHSSFELYNLGDIPDIEYIILSNAVKFYVKYVEFEKDYRVVAHFGKYKENIGICYSKEDADRALQIVMDFIQNNVGTDIVNTITPEMIESKGVIRFKRYSYGDGTMKRLVLKR